jgi:hypothetical protein
VQQDRGEDVTVPDKLARSAAYAARAAPSSLPADLARVGPKTRTDDVDEVAIERAVSGQGHEGLPLAEPEEVVRRLHALKHSDHSIIERVDLSERDVLRYRQQLGLPRVPFPEQVQVPS